jgi:hypothetical protein
MTDNSRPMRIRLESVVAQALAESARKAGQELADHTADLVTHAVMKELQQISPQDAKRVQKELEVKRAAIDFAVDETKRSGFNPHITLKTFQHIRTELRPEYECAIGERPGEDVGNHIKARINRTLGAAIKSALGAVSQTANGNPLKVQVSDEFIRSYTPLQPGATP